MPGFSQRPLDPVGAFGRVEIVVEVDFLECGVGQQHLVEGTPDRAHSSDTEPFDEPVPADHKAVHLWSGSHVSPSVIFFVPRSPSAACHLDRGPAPATSSEQKMAEAGSGKPDQCVPAQRRTNGAVL